MFIKTKLAKLSGLRHVMLYAIFLLSYQVSHATVNKSLRKPSTKCSYSTQIGQVLVTSAPDKLDLWDLGFFQDIRTHKLGGVILLGTNMRRLGNGSKVKSYIRKVRRYSRISPFIAIDQEGGQIQPLNVQHGVELYPTHQVLGYTLSEEGVYDMAYAMGKTLKDFGFNWNFAPVLDVNFNTSNPIIAKYERAFSSDPKIVSIFGSAFAKGMKDSGILSTAKHFPGHGSTVKDSHRSSVYVPKTLQELESSDLLAFNQLDSFSTVMTGHITLPKICGNLPTSLSSCMIENYLLKKLNFAGLVVTDSLSMKAIKSKFGLDRVGEMALNAGNDVLLTNYEDLHQIRSGLCKAANMRGTQGDLLRKRLDDAYIKILNVKKSIGLFEGTKRNPGSGPSKANSH